MALRGGSMRRASVLTCVVSLIVAFAATASATTINFSTSTGNWTVTGAGATNAPAAVLGGGGISITSNGLQSGTFVAGASLAAFDGFWTANFSFFLPADADNISGSFSNLRSDDRVVLYLNGNQIGDGGLGIPAGGSIAGLMELTDGGGNLPFFFDSSDSSGAGSGPAGFILGGENTLTAILNNTGSGVTGITKTFAGAGDGVNFGVQGQLTFTTAVPEPSTFTTLFGGCFLFFAALYWSRIRSY
jgi:hypothetical protein